MFLSGAGRTGIDAVWIDPAVRRGIVGVPLIVCAPPVSWKLTATALSSALPWFCTWTSSSGLPPPLIVAGVFGSSVVFPGLTVVCSRARPWLPLVALPADTAARAVET